MSTTTHEGLIGLTTRLSKAIHRNSSEEILGISLRGFVVLSYLQERDAVPQQELGDAMCLDANSTVLLLHELEDAEYITRRRDPSDRRRHIIEPTAAGRDAYTRAQQGRESIEGVVFVGLDADERAQLGELIRKALHGLARSQAPDADGGADPASVGAAAPA
jgi:DNA-binding MarR family transcriptional regulator